MNKEELLDSIGQVKEEYIVEAAPKGLIKNDDEEPIKKNGLVTKLYPYLKWGAMAACLCLIIGLSMKMNLFSAAKEDAAFEMKDAVMNQAAESTSGRGYDNLKIDTWHSTDYAETDFNTSKPSTEEYELLPETPTQCEDAGFPDWGLSLSVKNVSSTGLTLVAKQEGGNPTGNIMTGDPYYLITLSDGTWKTVEELPLPEGVDGRAFNSIGYWIYKGETREFDINWEWIFGELPSGTYRLVKEFMDFRVTGEYDTFNYWVEFEIK